MLAIYKSFTICCVFAFNRLGVHAGAGDDEKTSPNLAGPIKEVQTHPFEHFWETPIVDREWMHSWTNKKDSLGQLFHSQAPLLSSLKEESIDCLQLSVSRVAHVCPSEMTGRSSHRDHMPWTLVNGWGSTVIVYCCACCCYLAFILFLPFVVLCFF